MSEALKGFNMRQTPQSEPIPGSTQVPNSAGGYTYEVDFQQRLLRFLILGSDGGTYYIGERKLTKDNAMLIVNALSQGGPDRDEGHGIVATMVGKGIVDTIVEVSTSGRAPKNDPALFALALCASFGTIEVKQYAFDALPQVARIGTHLFHFVTYMEQFRGWGELAVRGISDWYLDKPVDKLIREVTKYQQRDGWSHRDLMRLSHPKIVSVDEDEDIKTIRNDVFKYVVDGIYQISTPEALEHGDKSYRGQSVYAYMDAVEEIKSVGDPGLAANLIITHGLPREVVPTHLLNHKHVWEALLQGMPVMAMVRNLATMTRVGVLEPMGHYTRVVVDALGDQKRLQKSRIHPLSVLSALLTYQAGKGFRGKNTWTPIREIVDALDAAFYLSFGNVEPVNKPIMLALDVSGSMTFAGDVANVPGLTPRVASAAMALITANVEKQYMVTAFTEGGGYYRHPGQRPTTPFMTELTISPRQRLDDVVKLIDGLPFGGTDCALPMLHAGHKGYDLDGFVIYTDSETWAGTPHPSQALLDYRQKTGRYARMAVVGMVSNGFTIADPEDAGQMDVVGFDTATPNIISAFLRGEI